MGVWIPGLEIKAFTDGTILKSHPGHLMILENGHAYLSLLNFTGTGSRDSFRVFSIPQSSRLIQADALLDKVIVKYLEHERRGELVFSAAEIKQDICDLICNAPTIILAEEN